MWDRIVVVEDDDVVAGLLTYLLEREGYVVERVPDGRAAMRRIEQDPPSLVILDIGLPYASGHEIALRMRRTPGWDDVPVLMLSARGEVNEVVRALDGGADDFIEKPFRPEELAARVRRSLRARAGL